MLSPTYGPDVIHDLDFISKKPHGTLNIKQIKQDLALISKQTNSVEV